MRFPNSKPSHWRYTVLSLFILVGAVGGCSVELERSVVPEQIKQANLSCIGGKELPTRVGNESEQRQLAVIVADSWIKRHPAVDMGWDWGPAVLAHGMLDLYERTGDPQYRKYVEDWLYSWEGAYPQLWSDTVAPAALAARLAAWDCDPIFWRMATEAMRYLEDETPRTEQGGISHLGVFLPGVPQLWVDSLFMFGGLMMGYAEASGSREPLYMMAEQVQIFSDLLQDPGTGLYRHAWLPDGPYPEEAVFWGRGNGWVAFAVGRLVEMLGEQSAAVKAVHKKLMDGVLATQDPSGLWWTVMNQPGTPTNYLEVSASALFAEGLRLGMESGVIAGSDVSSAYALALSAVVASVDDPNGQALVQGISTATQPSTAEWYGAVPVEEDVHYGVGAVIMSLSAVESQ